MVLVAISKEYFYGIVVVVCIFVVMYGVMHVMINDSSALNSTVKIIRSVSGSLLGGGGNDFSGGTPKRTRGGKGPGSGQGESSRLLEGSDQDGSELNSFS
jgi:hypothetical protein